MQHIYIFFVHMEVLRPYTAPGWPSTFDQGCGGGSTPFFITVLELLARVTLYLTDVRFGTT